MRPFCALAIGLLVPSFTSAAVLHAQMPVAGGGVSRWSQLWQDPGPNGNDLDGDSVCWADFTLTNAAAINHMEWWGAGACELGFRIEFWRQDPGTIAYQPLAVFDYGGGVPRPTPQARFDTTGYTAEPAGGGLTHFALDLDTPINLPANDAANPRWFVGIIGLTHQAYVTWNWSQGAGAGHTFQFVRGGFDGGGYAFRALGDGRALLLADASVPEPAAPTVLLLASGATIARRRTRLPR